MTLTELIRQHSPYLLQRHSSKLSKVLELELKAPEYGGGSDSHPLD